MMSSVAFSPKDFDLPILDAHHHFFLLEGEAHYPWLQDEYDDNFFLGDYAKMCKTFGIDEYKKSTKGFNVVGTIHVEAERSRAEQVQETLDLVELSKTSSLPSAIVGHVYFTQPNLEEVLQAHSQHSLVRGIRSKPLTSSGPDTSVANVPGSLQDPLWQEGLSALAKYGLSWDLRVPFWHLAEAAEVLEDHPGLPVVLNHAGLPLDRSTDGLHVWRRGMEALSQLPNVTVKVSELGLKGGVWDETSNKHVIRETTEIFGFERSMFASNLPVCTLSTSFLELVKTIVTALPDASEGDLTSLFSQSAARFYKTSL